MRALPSINLKGKNAARVVAVVLALATACALLPQAAFAYYERTPVSISLSSSSVQVAANGTANVSCKVTPESEKQLPGCGMEECPQTCGDGCLNADGWCTCAGNTYETYKTSVSVTSSAANVATGSYSNGVLKVKGISQGTATLTLTGQLSKHTDATAYITVTVSGHATPSDDSGSGTVKPDGNSNSGGSGSSGGKNHKGGAATIKNTNSGMKAAQHSASGVAVSRVSSTNAAATQQSAGKNASSGANSADASSATSADGSSAGLSVGFTDGLALAANSTLASLDLTGSQSASNTDEVPAPVLVATVIVLAALAAAAIKLKRQGRL